MGLRRYALYAFHAVEVRDSGSGEAEQALTGGLEYDSDTGFSWAAEPVILSQVIEP